MAASSRLRAVRSARTADSFFGPSFSLNPDMSGHLCLAFRLAVSDRRSNKEQSLTPNGRTRLSPQLLDERPADEAAHSVGLPTRQLHDFGQRCTLREAHQFDHFAFLTAFAGDRVRILGGSARCVAAQF